MAATTSPYLSGDFLPRRLGPKPDVVPTEVIERKTAPYGGERPDMVTVNIAHLGSGLVQQKLNLGNQYVSGTIHPFRKPQKTIASRLIREFSLVSTDRRARKVVLFGILNILCTGVLISWCNSTNSMALTAYTYITIFDLFRILTCMISHWVALNRPTATYSFGYERFEVLVVFASTVMAQLGALFILKESVVRVLEPTDIHTGRLLLGTAIALFFHLLTMIVVPSKAFSHVSEAASTSWLQEHVADLSRSLCGVLPSLSGVLLPRMNPFVLIDIAGAVALFITYMLVEMSAYYAVDTMSAMAIALMTFGTMYPMSLYSGKVLLQTTPSHMVGQLDKLLREASTLDGVLEFRNEHFWTLKFGSLAGSVHVRVRRDANEQLVLAHVTNRLSVLVSPLTVQIFKDDWSRPNLNTGGLAPGNIPASDWLVTMPHSLHSHSPLTSTPTKSVNPTAEFSFGTPGLGLNPVALPRPHPPRAYAGGFLPQRQGLQEPHRIPSFNTIPSGSSVGQRGVYTSYHP
uniref:zinc transporter 6 isoform X2 n=1 Tax=Myxine glutinosa TaxID=7769 RepID=UPI00358F0D11